MAVRARVARRVARRPRHPVRLRRRAVQNRGAGGPPAARGWSSRRGGPSGSCFNRIAEDGSLCARSCIRWTSCRPRRRQRPTFSRQESRWNANGAFVGYRRLLAAIPRSLRGAAAWRAGDRHRFDSGHACRRPTAARVESDNGAKGEGRVVVTSCDAAPAVSCLFFGESCAYRMLPYLAESFRRLVFVHLHTLDHELVEAERPDVVVALPTRRVDRRAGGRGGTARRELAARSSCRRAPQARRSRTRWGSPDIRTRCRSRARRGQGRRGQGRLALPHARHQSRDGAAHGPAAVHRSPAGGLAARARDAAGVAGAAPDPLFLSGAAEPARGVLGAPARRRRDGRGAAGAAADAATCASRDRRRGSSIRSTSSSPTRSRTTSTSRPTRTGTSWARSSPTSG